MTKVTVVHVRGRAFDVYVTGKGMFQARLEARTVEADCLANLKDKLASRLARLKVRVEVPFTDAQTLRDGVLTGYHATTGRPLIRWKDGRPPPDDSPDFLRPLPAEEKDQVRALRRAYREALEALQGYVKERQFNAQRAVEDANRVALERELFHPSPDPSPDPGPDGEPREDAPPPLPDAGAESGLAGVPDGVVAAPGGPQDVA